MRLIHRLLAYVRVLPRGRPTPATREALRYLARRPALLVAIGGYETAVLVSNRVELRLKYLAVLKTSSHTGCPF